MEILNYIADKSYELALKRNKITKETEFDSIVFDLQIEMQELIESRKVGMPPKGQNPECMSDNEFVKYYERFCKNTRQDEIADLILISAVLAKHLGFDLPRIIMDKLKYNSLRED